MKVDVYQNLLLINSAFDQVVRSLVALRKHRRFHGAELNRFRRQSDETRASVNSDDCRQTRFFLKRRGNRGSLVSRASTLDSLVAIRPNRIPPLDGRREEDAPLIAVRGAPMCWR